MKDNLTQFVNNRNDTTEVKPLNHYSQTFKHQSKAIKIIQPNDDDRGVGGISRKDKFFKLDGFETFKVKGEQEEEENGEEFSDNCDRPIFRYVGMNCFLCYFDN